MLQPPAPTSSTTAPPPPSPSPTPSGYWGLLTRLPSSTWMEGPSQFLLSHFKTTIGRTSNSNFKVPLKLVSSHHCTLRYNPATHVVHIDDLSTNGSYVNGKRVGKGKSITVSSGATLSLGKMTAGRGEPVPNYRLTITALVQPTSAAAATATTATTTTATTTTATTITSGFQLKGLIVRNNSIVVCKTSNTIQTINPYNETINWKPGIYVGHIDTNGQPHGRGIAMEVLKWVDNDNGKEDKAQTAMQKTPHKLGKQFDGTYEHGIRTGQGTILYPDGKEYNGYVAKNGKPHGYGCETRNDGDRFIGVWKNGKRHGLGVRMWPEGQTYAGEWTAGKMNGVGMFTWPSGLRYLGDWKEHKRHGLGVEIHQDTTTSHYYCGQWSNGKRHGYGERCKREAGQTWAGAFIDGRRDRKQDHTGGQHLGWKAAHDALPVARKAADQARASMEEVGRSYLGGIRHSSSVQEAINAMNRLYAAVSDPMVRISVREVLQCVTDRKRRSDSLTRKCYEDEQRETESKKTMKRNKWTRDAAMTFGKLLQKVRITEKERKNQEQQLYAMLKASNISFGRTKA